MHGVHAVPCSEAVGSPFSGGLLPREVKPLSSPGGRNPLLPNVSFIPKITYVWKQGLTPARAPPHHRLHNQN
jgi:hypothetical protein